VPRKLLVLAIAAWGGACGSSSAVKSDASVDLGTDTGPSLHYLTGTLSPSVTPPCIMAALQLIGGEAQCTMTENFNADGGSTTTDIPSCDETSAPCWALTANPTACPNGGLAFSVADDPANPHPAGLTYSYSCVLCTPGVAMPGC
jgi:hypothetical protein